MTMSRRSFLTYLGMGSYALLTDGAAAAKDVVFPTKRKKGKPPAFFSPIQPSTEDRLILPDGFERDVVIRWDDDLGTKGPFGPERFGFNNDFLAFFPIDALTGGNSNDEGLLWVNHEYPNPLFVSKHNDPKKKKTREQIRAEKLSVGGSVIHVRRTNGCWTQVPGSKHTCRFTALYPKIKFSGPASDKLHEGVGTLANCSGGRTPWNTVLTCEENYQSCNPIGRRGQWGWSAIADEKVDEERYGWITEVDPFGELPPLKHSALGRFAHENAAMRVSPASKQLVVYMGDDATDQHLYKFVSNDAWRESATRAEQRKLLTEGTLYVADLKHCRWLALDWERNKPLLSKAGLKSQTDVVIHARRAARALGASKLDRPEDCEVHPKDGTLYVALTNNEAHGNHFGQILRLIEDDDKPEGESFRYEIFLAGGPQSGLASPDNLLFDADGNLWVVTDISTGSVNARPYDTFGNNGLFVVPTRGASAGDAFQFASGPVDAEITGPWMLDSRDTLFVAVQHPGENSTSEKLTSHWPDGGAAVPRPSVVAIRGKFA